MRIRLDRIEPAIHAGNRRAQRLCTRAHAGQVIDVARRRGMREGQQFAAAFAPPRRGLDRLILCIQFAPARAEHRGVFHAHGFGLDQQIVQARHQVGRHFFVDDEGQIEIVRRLRDQVHALRAELGEHRRKPVQHRTHAAADQGDRRARCDDFDPADFCQVRAQRREHVGVHQVLARIQRHGDVGLGRTDQVDRQAVALEVLEHIGEKTDLLPHADRFHRDQGDAAARADRLDARRRVGRARGDLGTGHIRMIRVLDQQRHARLAQRIDAARMQHLGAGGGDFLRFLVVQPREQARIRHLARIRAEHAGHVGPYFHFFRFQQRAEITGRRIRTATAQDHGFALGIARHETLGNEHVAACGQGLAQRGIECRRHRCREIAAPGVLVRQRHAEQMLPGVEPMHRESTCIQIGHAERARHLFAERQHFGLPRQAAGFRAHIRDQRIQAFQPIAHRRVIAQSQLGEHGLMAREDFIAQRTTPRRISRSFGDCLELVGDA